MQTRTYAIAAGVALAGILGALTAYVLTSGGEDRYASCVGGETSAALGGPFELISETGETVTDADVITRPSLLYFGYTFCPDVCPLDVVRNVEAAEILAERGLDVQPVFISVDWGRDTAETMDDFTANISPDLLGLTGDEAQVRTASQAYRTYYNFHDMADEYYLIDHSTFSYLVFPDTGFAGFFRRELSGEQLADRLTCFLEA